MLSILGLLPTLVTALPKLLSLSSLGLTSTSLSTLVPEIVPLLENVGKSLFPKLAPELHAIAAATTAFNPNFTMWLQGSLNGFLNDPSLELAVDGAYGPKTVAAVEAVQAKLGLNVDGWAGTITRSALSLIMTKSAVPAVATQATIKAVAPAAPDAAAVVPTVPPKPTAAVIATTMAAKTAS